MPKTKTVADLFVGLATRSLPTNWDQLSQMTVKSIQHDSRRIEAGDIFVAVAGFEADGHHYLPQAQERGALLAVVEEPRPDLDLPQVLVANSRLAQAELGASFYDHPSQELSVCGITGSNGKTSTSLMYRQIIEQAKGPCGLIGTVAYESGTSTVASNLTTPDSLDLQRYLREMSDNGYRYVVMEVSSIGLDQDRPHGTAYDVAAFINIGREHLDYHGDLEHYLAAKKKLLKLLKPEAVVVLNLDDKLLAPMAEELKHPVLTFGTNSNATLRAENVDLSTGFARFDLVFDPQQLSAEGRIKLAVKTSKSWQVQLKVPGFHSVYNALAAAACALVTGANLEECVLGLEAYGGVERRFQLVYDGDFRIFDDHFANSKNIAMTLTTLSKMDYRQLVICYAVRGKRGVTVNRENIEALNNFIPQLKIKEFIATSSQDVVGHYDEVQPEELLVYREEMAQNTLEDRFTDTLDEAMELSLEAMEPGDVLLLAGCQGMDAGARIALNKLADRYPQEREKILLPLKDRVCGW
ncbi:MAG: Mur ligase family protein [Eubacteriales bacterium]|nr:Mur ligase family protein [Eubacteriales bacterium]